MGFKFENGKLYLMPVVFGPGGTPRQKPDGGRFIYDYPATVEQYKIVYEADAEMLEKILPDGFKLWGPYLIISFAENSNVPWLARKSYRILHVEVPVHFKGKKNDIVGFFEPVLWENDGDCCKTGREMLGFAKVFGNIDNPNKNEGKYTGSASTWGFKFIEAEFFPDEAPECPGELENILANPEFTGRLHFKYFPKTGDLTQPEIAYYTYSPYKWPMPEDLDTSSYPKPTRQFCRATMKWFRPEWEDAPTQYHILQFFHDAGIKRFVGAALTTAYPSDDLLDQQVIK